MKILNSDLIYCQLKLLCQILATESFNKYTAMNDLLYINSRQQILARTN